MQFFSVRRSANLIDKRQLPGMGHAIKKKEDFKTYKIVNGHKITHGVLGRSKKAPVKPLPIDIPVSNKSMAEQLMFNIDGKSIFKINGEKVRLNQHSTRYTMSDGSYIIFTKNQGHGYESDDRSIGVIFHNKKDIL